MKDLESDTDAYLGQLSEVTGKPKEELAKDARHLKFLSAEETIGYGLADRIIYSMADCFDKQVPPFLKFSSFSVHKEMLV